MRPKLALPASRDIEEIYSFGLERWGAAQADEYLARFWEAASFIGEHPLAFRARQEVDPPVRVHRFGSHLTFSRSALTAC